MDNIIAVIILVLVLSLASLYVYREKKKGKKCIGCPYAKDCMNKNKCDS